MFNKFAFSKVNIILGHYGCGKTNLTANSALLTAQNGSTAVIDLDMVNPYFRSEDFKRTFSEKCIDLYAPNFAGTNLDIPSFDFEPLSVINSHQYTFIDVGGDDSGAFALGRFSNSLKSYGEDLSVLFVLNMYRDTKDDTEETVNLLREIEKAGRIKCTALVNNSNLGQQTDLKTVEKSVEFAEKISDVTKLPVAFTCVPEKYKSQGENIKGEKFFTSRLVKMPWEENY